MEPFLLPKQSLMMTTRGTSGIHNQVIVLKTTRPTSGVHNQIVTLTNNTKPNNHGK
jgi:hypothetical protein